MNLTASCMCPISTKPVVNQKIQFKYIGQKLDGRLHVADEFMIGILSTVTLIQIIFFMYLFYKKEISVGMK